MSSEDKNCDRKDFVRTLGDDLTSFPSQRIMTVDEIFSVESGEISSNQIATNKHEKTGEVAADRIFSDKREEMASGEISSGEDNEIIGNHFDEDENTILDEDDKIILDEAFSDNDDETSSLTHNAFKSSVISFMVENRRDTMELIDALQDFDNDLRQALDNFKVSLSVCEKSVDVLKSLSRQEGNIHIGMSCSLLRSLQQCFSMMSSCVTVLSRLRLDAQDNYNEFLKNSLDVLNMLKQDKQKKKRL